MSGALRWANPWPMNKTAHALNPVMSPPITSGCCSGPTSKEKNMTTNLEVRIDLAELMWATAALLSVIH